MKEYFDQLGSKIKMLFDNKHLEDKKLAQEVNSNLIDIEDEIKATKKAIENAKDTFHSGTNEAIHKFIKSINEKDLSVKVEPPIVNVPEPKIEIIKETKEAEKSNELLTKLLYAIIKQSEAQGLVKITNYNPEDAIPVRLTDKSGKKFYNAIMQAFASSGFNLSFDKDGSLMVNVSGGQLSINNLPEDYPLPLDQFNALIPPAAISGFATEVTLLAVLNKLISNPATSTKQDSIIAAINSDPQLTPQAPATASIGLVSTQIVAANANRRGLIITNLAAKDTFLAFGANNAVVNSGIVLMANGGTWTMDRWDRTTSAVRAIGQVNPTVLAIQEFI